MYVEMTRVSDVGKEKVALVLGVTLATIIIGLSYINALAISI